MAKLERQKILLNNASTLDGDPYVVNSQGRRMIIVQGDTVGAVNIQVESNSGTFVNIADGAFTENEARVMEGIISGCTIRAVVAGGTNVTVEISE
jgi:hypothetical protein